MPNKKEGCPLRKTRQIFRKVVAGEAVFLNGPQGMCELRLMGGGEFISCNYFGSTAVKAEVQELHTYLNFVLELQDVEFISKKWSTYDEYLDVRKEAQEVFVRRNNLRWMA